MLSFSGSMVRTMPFLMAGASGLAAVASGSEDSPSSAPGTAAAHAAPTEDLRNSRRFPSDMRPRSYLDWLATILLRSRCGSQTSVDLRISSHVTSRPVYAAVRAIMQESADSAPAPD